MAVTPVLPNLQPLKSKGFYSFVVTIPDDDFCSWTPTGSFGHVFISSNGTSGHGIAMFYATGSVKVAGPATFVCVNTSLNGTTGVDTNLTFGSAAGVLYLENRLGASSKLTVTVFAAEDALEV